MTITAAPARIAMVPGKPADVYAYNGSVPGPTLEAHEGDHVIIHYHNRLPEESTIHCHGIHLPARMDGSPLEIVPPGGDFDYDFTLKAGSAGTYWYHPHPDNRSEYQVSKGLYGAIVVRAKADPLAAFPEKLLILSDNRFTGNGSIDFADASTLPGELDAENGREGNVFFVNGQIEPAISIRAGETQRWRVINASASRIYRLAVAGRTLLHVGSDGGLFEHPVAVKELLLANSERAEFLVTGGDTGGETGGDTGGHNSRHAAGVAKFETLPYDRYASQTRPGDWDEARTLATLRTNYARPVLAPPIPNTLRVIPPLDTGAARAIHVVVFSQGLINNAVMDMHRVDVHATLNATDIWEIQNVVAMDHPFHLHGFQFQVLDRDGVPEPFRSWKDVVNVPKHSSVRIIVRYTDYPGRWMFHCHILGHEDHGMMAILEVK
ncbi:MAG: multicopper oxidase family protein [Gemmatimonadota bacterium]|nr:multicopper oxidase family protein [Gemmatimonadota bacterium]